MLGARYRVDEEIGHGGMATVWSGQDLRLRRPVAVKILDPARFADRATRQRFWREAQAVAALPHPHIVAVYDVAVEAAEAYVVMELVDGPSVHALLQDGPLHRDQAVGIAVQTCAALAAAHSAGIVHRDVTAANLLVNSSGVVKVCDFGIAAWQEAAYPSLVAGTRGYTAPEQAAGGPVDARTDVFGLGCSLYAMLTGAPRRPGTTARAYATTCCAPGCPSRSRNSPGGSPRPTPAPPGQRRAGRRAAADDRRDDRARPVRDGSAVGHPRVRAGVAVRNPRPRAPWSGWPLCRRPGPRGPNPPAGPSAPRGPTAGCGRCCGPRRAWWPSWRG
ncbi:serine/threonine-protein kinase [Catellatospora coxensis]